MPFIFGSLQLGGWGVLFDVEPRDQTALVEQPLDSKAMNGSVFLDRAIVEMQQGRGCGRKVLVPAEHAGSRETGGLELAISRVDQPVMEPPGDRYRIVSIQSGKATVRIADVECEVGEHDHFGIPDQLACDFTPIGTEPLVYLDARILPL